ncbi:hypothetical protein SS209_03552 [Salmonella enterica subsp. enterica serovar Senftenberg str. SS209]|nr:hypothetical protein SS209_03552 [Salmonella enterica subsp. enterica serovar Senftenberg str. SS209]
MSGQLESGIVLSKWQLDQMGSSAPKEGHDLMY